MLKEKIDQDYIISYKEKDELKISVLRILKSAIKNAEIDKKDQLSDEEIIAVIKREIKQRNDAIEIYKKSGKEEALKKEKAESELLKLYLPVQMNEDEIRHIAKQTIQDLNASDVGKTGQVIGSIMNQCKGKADGAVVSKIVRELLQNK